MKPCFWIFALSVSAALPALAQADALPNALPVETSSARAKVFTSERARSAEKFVESIGVGSRFDWMFGAGKIEIVRRALRDSKIRSIRTGVLPEGTDAIKYTEAMREVTLDLNVQVLLNVGWDARARLQDGIARWTQAPSPVYALEGVNESFTRPDWGDREWNTALDVQKFIWQEGRARNLQVYSWTLGGPAGFYWHMPQEADQFCTHANFHPYHWYANPHGRGNTKMNGLWQNTETPENRGLVQTVRDDWMRNPEKPLASSEFGWGLDTLPGNYVGVSQSVQAKYLSRALFENFNAGLERGFIYSLFPHNDDFGIANDDGSLRPSGRAIAALITLLEERDKTPRTLSRPTETRPTSSRPTETLRYELKTDSGMPVVDDHELRNVEIHHSLLQKSDNRFYLVLWADQDSQSDATARGAIAPEAATLTLADGAQRVRVFLPMTNGTTPVSTLPAVPALGTVRLQGGVAVPDHPMLLEITPLPNPQLPNARQR